MTTHATEDTESKFFVCRLLGPRPTFMFDMSAEERALMQAHAGYWMQQMAAGRVVVFGPVADPKGGWGLGVVRVPDEAAVRELEAGDPVIKANVGFSYEILPMLRAIVAG